MKLSVLFLALSALTVSAKKNVGRRASTAQRRDEMAFTSYSKKGGDDDDDGGSYMGKKASGGKKGSGGECPTDVGYGKKGGTYGKGGKGGGSSKGCPEDLDEDRCCICQDGRPNRLTLTWTPDPSANSEFQDESKASCRYDDSYPSETTLEVGGATFDVVEGDTFTLAGDFDANTEFCISGWGCCTIHTSCSVPIVEGDTIGPFTIVATDECDEIPPDEDCDGDCIICDKQNKERPDSLTFIYKPDGRDSLYQDSSKASCGEDQYPEPGVFTIEGVDYEVSDGEVFTVYPAGDRFDAETDVHFEDDEFDCYFHTSCSAPLVAGDQIGPFLLTEGNDCVLECIVVDKTDYQCGEPIEVSFNFNDPSVTEEPLTDDWVGIYPCETGDRFMHAEVWQWACGADTLMECEGPTESNVLVFDSLPPSNEAGPHTWPVAPYYDADGNLQTCFKAVLLRFDGPSVPPYVPICQSPPFDISPTDAEGCGIRPFSTSVQNLN